MYSFLKNRPKYLNLQWTKYGDHGKEMLVSLQTILLGILLVIHGDLFVWSSGTDAHQTHKSADDFFRVWIVEVSNLESNPKLLHHVDDLILRENGKRKQSIRRHDCECVGNKQSRVRTDLSP